MVGQTFYQTIVVVWQLQVLAWLGIFWLISATNISAKIKMLKLDTILQYQSIPQIWAHRTSTHFVWLLVGFEMSKKSSTRMLPVLSVGVPLSRCPVVLFQWAWHSVKESAKMSLSWSEELPQNVHTQEQCPQDKSPPPIFYQVTLTGHKYSISPLFLLPRQIYSCFLLMQNENNWCRKVIRIQQVSDVPGLFRPARKNWI